MGYHHRYKSRDFDFAQQLVALRKRAGLTQEEVALSIGVAEKSIRNWEGGSNYPSAVNLQRLIELCLHRNALTPGQEQEEASTLWEIVHERTSRRIGSFNEQWFAVLFQQWHESHQPVPQEQHLLASLPPPTPDAPVTLSSLSPLLLSDWNAAPEVSALYGRTDEFAELERWLLTDHCRLVAVLGMGGIGKTALTVKFIEHVAPHFACVQWRSLQNAPLLEDLLSEWLPVLSEQHYTNLPQGVEQRLALLLKCLQQRRCLIVLDNLETLFQEGVLEGRYRQDYDGYATLIRLVAETPHQSCLLLTCREKFPDLGVFTGKQTPVRLLRLSGLAWSACQQLLWDKDLFGDQAAWSELVERYAGNPLALKIVAEVVHDLFGGDIAAFLAEGFTTFHGIRQLLSQQFERLSALEQTLMYWLAIEREFIPLEALWKDLSHPVTVTKSEILEAMHSLLSRSLVERGEHGARFTLQPVVQEYVTERLIAQVSRELCENKPALFLTHALLQGQAKDYIRMSQERLLLQPVLDQLLSHFGTTQALEEYCEQLLQQLRAMSRARQGYGGGNTVNLLVKLNGHVRGKDCSHLTIRQADLQKAEAQDALFVGADLTGSTFMEDMESVMSMALSADGQYVAGGSNNGQIRVWCTTNGQPLLTLLGHEELVWSMAFHPESKLLVSGSYGGQVRLWEISSGQCLSILQGHTKWVRSVIVHPGGRLVATGGDDRSIRLWDLHTSCCVGNWQEQDSEIWFITFSPDGQLLASGQANGVVKLWALTNEQCLWSSAGHQGAAVTSLAFSPDGAWLVSGAMNTTIMVWEVGSGTLLSTLSGHTDIVYSLSFRSDGLLASGSRDRSVKLWKIGCQGTNGQCVGTLHGHTDWIWWIAFGPEGLLASGSQDGTVKLWQINKEGDGGTCLRTLQGYAHTIHLIAPSSDGALLVSAERNGQLKIWDTLSRRCLHILSRQEGVSLALAFGPDGRLVAQSTHDRTIRLWDVASGQCLRTLRGHMGEIWSLVFSPDGRFLFSGCSDMTIKRWAVDSGQCLTTFQGHHGWIWSLTCSSDGRRLASGDTNGMVKVWDIGSQECLHTLCSDPQAIVTLAFTPDSTTLLSSNIQNLVTVWNMKSGHGLKTIPGSGETYWLDSTAFSPDGRFLASASRDRTVKVWNINDGRLLHTLPCQAGRPWSVAWSADQRWLACGTDEGTILLFEWQTGECLMTLRSDRPYERMNISGVTGITPVQKTLLKTLGAIEEENKTQQEKSGSYSDRF